MNYFDIKFIHQALGLLFLFTLLSASYNPTKKLFRLANILIGFLLMISGVTSSMRLGLPMDETLPLWAVTKIVIGILLILLPHFLYKKFPGFASKFNLIFLGLMLVAVFMGVYKP